MYIDEMKTFELLNELKRRFKDGLICTVEPEEKFLANITVGDTKESLIKGSGHAVIMVLSNPVKRLILDDPEKLASLKERGF